jgi:hypothetical protein
MEGGIWNIESDFRTSIFHIPLSALAKGSIFLPIDILVPFL